jgi:hypothetical protein
MSYKSQLGRKCDQNEGCSNDVEVRPNAGRVKTWPFPRLNANAAEISKQQTDFVTKLLRITPSSFPQ